MDTTTAENLSPQTSKRPKQDSYENTTSRDDSTTVNSSWKEESFGPDIFDPPSQEEEEIQALGDNDEDSSIQIGPDPRLRYAADAHVEAELAKLNPTEREKVYFDVYGISSLPVETPELIHESLDKFQQAIDRLLSMSSSSKEGQATKHQTKKRKDNNESDYLNGLGLRGIFSTKAYRLALSMDPSYTNNPQLRLAFLRREKYANIPQAAKKYIQWFSVKHDLFGSELLTQTITQDDLEFLEQKENGENNNSNENNNQDNPALGALTGGYKQVLPLRDNAGRLVFCDLVGNSSHDASIRGLLKLRRKFYMSMVAAEDPETQRKGAIMVWYAVNAVDEAPLDQWSFVKALLYVLDCTPLRIEAVHSCHNNRWSYAAKTALFRLTMGIFVSARTRVHVGPHDHCLFKLQTYGVPTFCMPLSADGRYQPTRDQNAKLWKQRREYERQLKQDRRSSGLLPEIDLLDEDIDSLLKDTDSGRGFGNFNLSENNNDSKSSDNSKDKDESVANKEQSATTTTTAATIATATPIFLPGQFDVLLGRGAGYHCHGGNVRLRKIIGQQVQVHANCETSEKKVQMTLKIVHDIQAQGGRFLRQSTDGWVAVSDQEARQKVGHTFRNMRAAASKKDKGGERATKRAHSD